MMDLVRQVEMTLMNIRVMVAGREKAAKVENVLLSVGDEEKP